MNTSRPHCCPEGRGGHRTRWKGLLAVLIAAAMLTAACGSGTSEPGTAPDDAPAEVPSVVDDVASTRSGAGIGAAGGNLAAFSADECDLTRAIRIAYVGPDVSELEAVGLASLVIEEPAHIIGAYLTEVNAHGGIHGRCVQSSIHLWSWANPTDSFARVCAEVPAGEPIVVISLYGDVRGVRCLTVDAELPVYGLYASVPATVQRSSRGRLFLDDGTVGYLLASSIEVSHQTGTVDRNAQVGLLYGPPVGVSPSGREYNIGADFEELVNLTGSANLIPGVITHVPSEFGQLANLGPEGRVRLLQSGLTASEMVDVSAALDEMSTEQRALLGEIEQFYLDAAMEHRDSGVAAIYATVPWFELRRMMRAAERIGWHPDWIASDIQGATLTLTDAPRAQADNFYLVSARPAAGDPLADLDRGCVGLRSAAADAPPFPHRHHTDAWGLLVATCDALDVTLSALSRISGPFSTGAFLEQLANTEYEGMSGGHLSFGPDDFSGSDRFRVLRADPGCVLDEWGCMRAMSEWLEPLGVEHVDDDE